MPVNHERLLQAFAELLVGRGATSSILDVPAQWSIHVSAALRPCVCGIRGGRTARRQPRYLCFVCGCVKPSEPIRAKFNIHPYSSSRAPPAPGMRECAVEVRVIKVSFHSVREARHFLHGDLGKRDIQRHDVHI